MPLTQVLRQSARDLRYAARRFARDRTFFAVALITLALGAGANTAIFTVLYNLVLRPLPYEQPNRLARLDVLVTTDTRGPRPVGFSAPAFRQAMAAARSFESLAAYRVTSFTLKDSRGVERVTGEVVSGSYFGLLGSSSAPGRAIQPGDDQGLEAHPVVMISHRLWRSRFDTRQDAVGEIIQLNGITLTIIGVASDGFRGHSRRADVWVPTAMEAVVLRGNEGSFDVIGRLSDGITLTQADAEFRGMVPSLFGRERRGATLEGRAVSLEESERDPQLRTRLRLAYGGACLVLLIACANVANLLLARGIARRRELAIRLSVGASRAAIVRLLMAESLLLGAAGVSLGFVLAVWTLSGLEVLRPTVQTTVWPTYVRALDIEAFSVSPPIMLFAVGLTLLTTGLFGLWPALRCGRFDLNSALTSDAGSWAQSRDGSPWRALILGQVALVLVLATTSGLLVRSFSRLLDRPHWIDPRGIVTFRMSLPPEKYTGSAAARFFERLQARLLSLPDVQGVARVRHLPVMERGTVTQLQLDASADSHNVGFNAVDPAFFRLFQVPLVAGRYFDTRDATSEAVAILTESAAHALFGDETPLGRRITVMRTRALIVGVIRDVWYEPQRPQLPIIGDVYVDFEQRPATSAYMAVRAGGDPLALSSVFRRAVAELDPELPLWDMATMSERVRSVQSYARFTAFVLAGSAGLALALAAIGIYGTLSYAVAARFREMSVRIALGADRSHILKIFLRDGMTTCAGGIIVGLPLAIVSARGMRAVLFGITPGDPLSFALAVVLVSAAAVVACLVPAWRAAHADPNVILRQ